ncbi:MAG: response regulator receiver protein [Chthoniobacteraceae bacterium]|nr:response regulator receiver protein [Chthoniobacteraceae bacterium]
MRVMIVDDDRAVAETIAMLVKSCEHEVVATVTGGGLEAMRSFAHHRPELVMLDIMMPKFNGFTVCHQLVSRDPKVKIVLMSGVVDQSYPSVGNCGAIDFMPKPLNLARVRETLDRIAGLREEPLLPL